MAMSKHLAGSKSINLKSPCKSFQKDEPFAQSTTRLRSHTGECLLTPHDAHVFFFRVQAFGQNRQKATIHQICQARSTHHAYASPQHSRAAFIKSKTVRGEDEQGMLLSDTSEQSLLGCYFLEHCPCARTLRLPKRARPRRSIHRLMSFHALRNRVLRESDTTLANTREVCTTDFFFRLCVLDHSLSICFCENSRKRLEVNFQARRKRTLARN